MEAAAVMKVEAAVEGCALCGEAAGAGDELRTLEEHEQELAAAGEREPGAPPLRAQLLHLAHNKALPEGRVCGGCAARGAAAYRFAAGLARAAPLSDKIRALRRRLHDLTQKIDVFIVVGSGQEGGSYSEQDIIMVERSALAAAAAADDEELERAHNARGDSVYQCSVCPRSFQRLSEFREHCAEHPESARHSCWTCGAQFPSRAELAAHARDQHEQRAPHQCQLCRATCQSLSALRQHSAGCAPVCPGCGAAPVCPGCGAAPGSRPALAAHAAAQHGPHAAPPHVCPVCFAHFPEAAQLTAHSLRHRLSRAFVCGHDGCILRFAARGSLLAHIRKCHAEPADQRVDRPHDPAQAHDQVPCDRCSRTFSSVAAMRRHARVHRGEGEGEPGQGERVEYLEVEALEEAEEELEVEYKPDL